MTNQYGDGALLVPTPEAARRLGLSVRELFNQRRAGRLPARKVGAKILFHVDDLRRFADTSKYEDVA